MLAVVALLVKNPSNSTTYDDVLVMLPDTVAAALVDNNPTKLKVAPNPLELYVLKLYLNTTGALLKAKTN